MIPKEMLKLWINNPYVTTAIHLIHTNGNKITNWKKIIEREVNKNGK